jgi:hypothetical protein
MSSNSVNDFFNDAQVKWQSVCAGYETKRQEVVSYAKSKLSPASGTIVERVSKSVLDVFVGLSAISGILTVPAFFVFAAKRVWPLKEYWNEMRREGSTSESVKAKWAEIKQKYKEDLKEIMGPVLFVVLTVDAVFSLTIGFLTLNPWLILRGGVVSAPAAYVMYNTIKNEVVRALDDPMQEQPFLNQEPGYVPPSTNEPDVAVPSLYPEQLDPNAMPLMV